jgi:hypothetical protein
MDLDTLPVAECCFMVMLIQTRMGAQWTRRVLLDTILAWVQL